LEWLRSNLKDRRKHVRWLCADSLGAIGKDSAFALADLRQMLMDSCPTVRAAAARSIWRISQEDTNVVDTLVGVLRDEEWDYYSSPISIMGYGGSSYCLALQSLAEIKISNDAVIEAIREKLESKSFTCRYLAVSTLLKLPMQNISALASERLRHAVYSDVNMKAMRNADFQSRIDALSLKLGFHVP
jgi:HEAT repeat protein